MSQQPPTQPTPTGEPRSLGEQAKLGGSLVAGLALILFFLQNLQDADINFLWFEWQTDMIWALVASAILGAVMMFLAQAFLSRRRKPPEPPKE